MVSYVDATTVARMLLAEDGQAVDANDWMNARAIMLLTPSIKLTTYCLAYTVVYARNVLAHTQYETKFPARCRPVARLQ